MMQPPRFHPLFLELNGVSHLVIMLYELTMFLVAVINIISCPSPTWSPMVDIIGIIIVTLHDLPKSYQRYAWFKKNHPKIQVDLKSWCNLWAYLVVKKIGWLIDLCNHVTPLIFDILNSQIGEAAISAAQSSTSKKSHGRQNFEDSRSGNSLKLTSKAAENRPGPKRKLVFQPSMLRCYVSFREGMIWCRKLYPGVVQV